MLQDLVRTNGVVAHPLHGKTGGGGGGGGGGAEIYKGAAGPALKKLYTLLFLFHKSITNISLLFDAIRNI